MAETPRAFRSIDDLPLFATDEEIAVAVVGPERAKGYLQLMPTLELDPSFPLVDLAHGGRYTPAVKAFYDAARRGARSGSRHLQPGTEDPGSWKRPRRERAR